MQSFFMTTSGSESLDVEVLMMGGGGGTRGAQIFFDDSAGAIIGSGGAGGWGVYLHTTTLSSWGFPKGAIWFCGFGFYDGGGANFTGGGGDPGGG